MDLVAEVATSLLEDEEADTYSGAKRLASDFDAEFQAKKRRKMTSRAVQRRRAGIKRRGRYGYRSKARTNMKRLQALEKKVTAISPQVKSLDGTWTYTDWAGLGSEYVHHNVYDKLKAGVYFSNNSNEIRLHSLHVRVPIHEHNALDSRGGSKLRMIIWSYKGRKGQETVDSGKHFDPLKDMPVGERHAQFLNTENYNIWYDSILNSYDTSVVEANIVFKYPLKMMTQGTSAGTYPITNDLYVTWVDNDSDIQAFKIYWKARYTQNNI